MRLKLKFFGLTLLLVAVGPHLLSTPYGGQVISKIVSSLSGYPCHIQGYYRYFQPIKLNQVLVLFPQGKFISQDILCNHLLSSVFTQKPLELTIHGFEITWTNQTSLIIHEASLTPFFALKLIPFEMITTFNQGRLLSSLYEPSLKNIEGHLIYSHHKPLDMALQAEADQGGFIKASGQFDPATQSASVQMTLHECPKDILPNSQFNQLLGPLLNATVAFSGSYSLGHTAIALSTEGLNFESSFTNQKKQLSFEGPTTLSLNQTHPFFLNGYEFETLNGSLKFLSGSVNLDDLTNFKDLEASIILDSQNFKTPFQELGALCIKGDLEQIGISLQANLNLEQNKKTLLNLHTLFNHKNKESSYLKLQTFNLPLVFLPSHLGRLLSCEGTFLINQGHLIGGLQGSTETVQQFVSQLDLSLDELNITQGFCNFYDHRITADLNIEKMSIPFKDLEKSSGKLKFNLKAINSVDKQFFPLTLDCDFNNLRSIKTILTSNNLNLKGTGLIDLKTHDLKCQDLWTGTFYLPLELTKLPPKAPCCGTFELSGSYAQNFHLNASLDPLILNEPDHLSAEHINLKTIIDPQTGTWQNHLRAQFIQKNELFGSIDANLELSKLQVIKGSISFKNPPLSFLTSYHELEKLQLLLGKNAQGDLKFDHQPQGYFCDLTLNSENISLSGSILYTDTLSVLKPLKGEFKLKKLELPFLDYKLPFSLKKQCDLKFNINDLTLPLNDLTGGWSFNGDLKATGLSLIQDQKMIQLDGFSLKLLKPSNQDSLTLEASGDLYSAYQKMLTTGSINLTVKIDQISGSWLQLDLSKALVSGILNLDHFPTLFLDFFQTKTQNPFTSTFGDTLQATITLEHQQKSGLLKCLATGKETLIKINASKTDELYHLSDDLIIQTRLSKELSECLFSSKPLGIEKLSSNYPLVARVAAQGSQFTLFPFATNKLILTDCLFDFGRVHLETDTILPQALNLLKSSPQSKNLPLWFQPLHFSINRGMVHIPRFDMLVADHFQMALWGEIDLNQEEVGLILGLTAQCLQKAFGISELPKNYVLQVPITGHFDQIKIDSKKAASKIAKILALQHGGQALEQFGGKSGGIVGGLLKELSKIPDGDKKAPPAQTPFPWEQASYKPKEASQKKKGIKSSDTPLQQVFKMFF